MRRHHHHHRRRKGRGILSGLKSIGRHAYNALKGHAVGAAKAGASRLLQHGINHLKTQYGIGGRLRRRGHRAGRGLHL